MNPPTAITAVQLRSAPRCELLAGEPLATPAGERGPVALFAPGAIVAYAVHVARPARLFVFRAVRGDDAGVALPGVHPRVQLLLAVESARVLRRARRLFLLLGRRGLRASDLPDSFFIRLDRVLRARAPLVPLATALLASTRTVQAIR
jgi:hypothetical protein